MPNPLEHAEHISHAGHGEGHGGGDHGGGHGGGHDNLGTYIGITMAVLGVVLAFCAAKVGAERTELIQALVEQQHAHAKYQAQDIKHRMAILNLRQTHSMIPSAETIEALDADLHKIEAAAASAPAAAGATAATAGAPKADAAKPDAAKPDAAKADPAAGTGTTTASTRALSRLITAELTPSKIEAAKLADTADRYYGEAQAANGWVESFNPVITAHMHAQERFELAQLLAEVGIVIASVALLLRQRVIRFLSLVLGAGALGLVFFTLSGTSSIVHAAEEKIEEHGKEYRDLRNADKALETDDELLAQVRKWTGTQARTAPVVHHEGGHEGGAHGGGEHPAGHDGAKPAGHDTEKPLPHHE